MLGCNVGGLKGGWPPGPLSAIVDALAGTGGPSPGPALPFRGLCPLGPSPSVSRSGCRTHSCPTGITWGGAMQRRGRWCWVQGQCPGGGFPRTLSAP